MAQLPQRSLDKSEDSHCRKCTLRLCQAAVLKGSPQLCPVSTNAPGDQVEAHEDAVVLVGSCHVRGTTNTNAALAKAEAYTGAVVLQKNTQMRCILSTDVVAAEVEGSKAMLCSERCELQDPLHLSAVAPKAKDCQGRVAPQSKYQRFSTTRTHAVRVKVVEARSRSQAADSRYAP